MQQSMRTIVSKLICDGSLSTDAVKLGGQVVVTGPLVVCTGRAGTIDLPNRLSQCRRMV